MRMEPDEIDSAADEHGDFDSYYRGFLGCWLFRWLRSRKPLANASRRRPLALSSSKRCDLEHFAPLPAALRPSRPVQQWVFHQAEKEHQRRSNLTSIASWSTTTSATRAIAEWPHADAGAPRRPRGRGFHFLSFRTDQRRSAWQGGWVSEDYST